MKILCKILRICAISTLILSVASSNSIIERLKHLDFMPLADDNFMTSDERKQIIGQVKETAASIYPRMYLLYFTSSSVDKYATANVLADVGRLQSGGVEIYSKQYMRGMPDNMQEFMQGWESYILGRTDRALIEDNFGLKFSPHFFSMYSIERAPALALAKCTPNPSAQSCRIYYLATGDMSLRTFFEMAKKENIFSELDNFIARSIDVLKRL